MRNNIRKKKIALLLIGVNDISGGGGTERLFADVYDYYYQQTNPFFDLYLLTDEKSYRILSSIGKLKDPKRLIRLTNYRLFQGKSRALPINIQLVKSLIEHKFDLIHACLPSRWYVPFLSLLSSFPKKQRPKITMNVVDCSLAHSILNQDAEHYEKQTYSYNAYFNFVAIDGVYTWYKLFKHATEQYKVVKRSNPIIMAAKFCFTDVSRFFPSEQKKKSVVYAARMYKLKRPFFFIEAVKIAHDLDPLTVQDWKFLMFGKGPLEKAVCKQIEDYQLTHLVQVSFQPDLAPIFAKSKLFVSTQEYENFTSLSMLEAMAAGNAIVSRNVGQTDYFVKHKQNGFLLSEDTPHNLALMMLEYMRRPDIHQTMQQKSREIATEIHTVHNFVDDIESFWHKVITPYFTGKNTWYERVSFRIFGVSRKSK